MPFFTPKVEGECRVSLHFKSGVPTQAEISKGLRLWDLKVEGKWQFKGYFEGQSGGKEGRRGVLGGQIPTPNPSSLMHTPSKSFLLPTFLHSGANFFAPFHPNLSHYVPLCATHPIIPHLLLYTTSVTFLFSLPKCKFFCTPTAPHFHIFHYSVRSSSHLLHYLQCYSILF